MLWPAKATALLLQADYWRQMCGSDNPVVEYGNDVEGTAFCPPDADDALGSTSWNLQVGNLMYLLASFIHSYEGFMPGLCPACSCCNRH